MLVELCIALSIWYFVPMIDLSRVLSHEHVIHGCLLFARCRKSENLLKSTVHIREKSKNNVVASRFDIFLLVLCKEQFDG